MATASLALSPKHGYHIDVRPPHDSDIPSEKRDRASRVLIFFIGLVVMILGPLFFCGLWGSMLHHTGIGLLVGVVVATVVCARYLPRFFIANDEWSGYVTQDMLGNEMVIYGPSFHLAKPWESRDRSHNYSLEIIPDNLTVEVQTKTAKITARVALEFARDLPNLDISIGSSHEAIKNSLEAFISSFLTGRLANKTADKEIHKIDEYNEDLAKKFMRHDDGTLGQFEAKSGFRVVTAVIASFALPIAVQKTRDAIDEAVALHIVTARLFGMDPDVLAAKVLEGKEITHDRHMQMMNRALAVSDNIKLDISGWEVNLPPTVIDMLDRIANKFTKK